jgi:hypothetical protein
MFYGIYFVCFFGIYILVNLRAIKAKVSVKNMLYFDAKSPESVNSVES